MNKNRMQVVSILLVLSCLMACSSQSKKTYLFTLHGVSDTVNKASNSLEGSLGVGPIELPESLQHSQIVVLGDKNQVLIDPHYIWAGDLKKSISRVLAANIRHYTGSDNVWAFPWDVRTRPQTQISLVVERLGGSLGGDVELKAQWRLLGKQGSELISIGRCELSQATVDASYASYVAAINHVVTLCSGMLINALP